jgi:hypothetical protein
MGKQGNLKKRSETAKSEQTASSYVVEHRQGITVEFEITENGYQELSKYDKEYIKDIDWPYQGTNDTFSNYTKHRGKWHCAVCDSLKIDGTIEVGFAPRYATCKKHHEFLLITPHLRLKAVGAEL